MLILGLDTETTGIDPATERITELGAVLWDWETRTPLELMSRLVDPERPISAEITELTGITDEMIAKHARPEKDVLSEFASLAKHADFIMAHNVPFDRPFYLAACSRQGVSPTDLNWLDSRTDVVYLSSVSTRKLKYLACEHGMLPFSSHRACFDVITMLSIASQYSLPEIIARAAEPTITLQALVSFADKDLAKDRGYHWKPESKQWVILLKQSDALVEISTCGFKTVVLPEPATTPSAPLPSPPPAAMGAMWTPSVALPGMAGL